MSQYYFNESSPLDSTGQVLWENGILFPQYIENTVSSFNGSDVTGIVIDLPLPSEYGFSSCCTDGNNGAFCVQSVGSLVQITSGTTLNTYSLPSGGVYSAVALLSGSPYILNAISGNISVLSGTSVVDTNVTLPVPCNTLISNGTSLYSLLPGSTEVAITTLSSLASGSYTTNTIPMKLPFCLAVSGTTLAVGGVSNASLASGFSYLLPYIGTTNTEFMLGVISGTVYFLDYQNEAWGPTTSIALSSVVAEITLVPNGSQALMSSVSGDVYVVNVTSSSMTLQQTISLADAASVAMFDSGNYAVVAQPSQNLVTLLKNTSGTWASGTTISITNPTTVYGYGGQYIAIGTSTEIAWYSYNGSSFVLENTISLPFSVSGIQQDSNGNFYVYGNSSTDGYLYLYSPTYQLLGSYSWAGNVTSLAMYYGQIAALDTTNNILHIFMVVNDILSAVSQYSLSGTGAYLAQGYHDLFLATSSNLLFYEWGPPYTLIERISGVCAIYNGSWVTVSLGYYNGPTAITFDSSGNVWVVTNTNQLIEISSTGTIISTTTLNSYTGQPSDVPVGISSLLWWNSHLYGTSSVSPFLMEII